jgi:hypothetical protein
MSDNEMQSTEKTDSRMVSFAPKSGTRCWRSSDARLILKTRSSIGDLDKSSTHTESAPIFRPGVIASDIAISPELPEAWCRHLASIIGDEVPF